jgi:hypothetical protein
LGSTRQNILNTLAYFDIFHYPLSKEEILLFHCETAVQPVIDEMLDELCKEEVIFRLAEFYSIRNDISLAQRRYKGNKFAFEQMKTARKAAKILSRFPYVKGLAVSGSLSKNYADESTDVDFFIITASNRLWVARSIMHLFYKLIYFSGRQRWFCMNYYVDESGLEIEEKNIFTAIEIATLLPMHGKPVLDDFMAANAWVRDYYPLCETNTSNALPVKKRFFSRLIEKMFNNGLGERLDNYLMKVTEKRWKKKMDRQMKNRKGLPLGMLVDKHCSKPNPAFFQNRVITQHNIKLKELLKKTTAVIRQAG